MKIQILNDDFVVCKVNNISDKILKEDFVFIGKTDEELSLVCKSSLVPNDAQKVSNGWRAFRICGVLDFSLIGVLANISNLLSENNISIFAISTYNTDYILVKQMDFKKAINVLAAAGIEYV